MANVPDNKKGLTLIKKAQGLITRHESLNNDWQALKTAYQNANPNVNAEGFPMTAQEVSDSNNMITAHATFMNDHSATITMLKNKDVGSHKGNALD